MTDKIIDKIKKLFALSKSDNVNEAAAAAAKAQALIERYKIQGALDSLLDEGAEGAEGFDDKIIHRTIHRFPGRVTTWILMLAQGIGKVNGVKVWFTSGTGPSGDYKQGYLSGAGNDESLALTIEMLSWLVGEVERLYAEDRPEGLDRGEGKRWANGFKNGAVQTIGLRLIQAQKEARAEARHLTGPTENDYKGALGNAEALLALDRRKFSAGDPRFQLAKLDSAIVKLDELYVKADNWASKEFGLRKFSRSLGGGDGFRKGKEAGHRAKLGSKGKLRG